MTTVCTLHWDGMVSQRQASANVRQNIEKMVGGGDDAITQWFGWKNPGRLYGKDMIGQIIM